MRECKLTLNTYTQKSRYTKVTSQKSHDTQKPRHSKVTTRETVHGTKHGTGQGTQSMSRHWCQKSHVGFVCPIKLLIWRKSSVYLNMLSWVYWLFWNSITTPTCLFACDCLCVCVVCVWVSQGVYVYLFVGVCLSECMSCLCVSQGVYVYLFVGVCLCELESNLYESPPLKWCEL